MKTNDLIAMLATEASATPTASPLRRCAQATAAGAAISLALVLTLWGLNPELNALAHTQAFWVKVVWLVLTCTFAAPVVMHLARPGVAAGRGVWGIAAALAGMALLALMQVATVDADTGMQLMLGHSWQECSASIAALSVPLLAALLWMLRDMAPTRPALAGASAGLMAGTLASLVYSLHCTETAYAFVAVWYVAGIAVMAGIGALMGLRLLRW
ncbi:hypothetical protein B9Z35_10235 [Limnohabitans sp. Jir61]|uniref:NrsF family protein n=1 Tax=Limnohabitans sp. Jir61 TaxID=1826168 RepID=UPI000D3A27E8|nr:DUF1109 domain-containing protein [Limnohabitans sp. Jir61]PUE29560.1 hypothetical protein B9Z35_10235 [Limnohabitans sp. Jir61]